MKPDALLRRVAALAVRPAVAWRAIAAETAPSEAIFLSYAMPLAVLPALCSGIGQLLYGHLLPPAGDGPGARVPVGPLFALGYAVAAYLQFLVAVAVAALVIRALARPFRLDPGTNRATKVSAYGATPYELGGIILLLPPTVPFQILILLTVIYGFVEVVLGLRATMGASALKAIPLAAIVLVLAFAASAAANAVLSLAFNAFAPV